MNGNDIGGAGTVSGTTGDFTNLKATGLTLGGNTGKTSATAYDIWVANAKSADSAKSVKASDITGNIDFSKITGLNGKIKKDMLESAVQATLDNVGTGGGKVYLPKQTAPKGTYATFIKTKIWNSVLGSDSTGGAYMDTILPGPDWAPTVATAVPVEFHANIAVGHGVSSKCATVFVISK